MKKSIIALATLGAIVGAAHAEQPNVTIYGIADAAFAHEDKGAALSAAKPGGSKSEVLSGGMSGSRIGFKGSEDLGDGMSAIFTLENGYNIDDGTQGQGGRLFGRQAWVGLNGDFGAVKLGRQNTPMRGALEAIDPFGFGGITGNLENIFNSAGNGGGFRMDNSVTYTTPSMGGFFAQLGYGFGEVANDTSALRQQGLAFGYANGPIYVAAAYHDINNDATTGGSSNTTMVGGTYDLKTVKFHLAYEKNKGDTTAGGTVIDSNDTLVGVSAPFGASSVMASYVMHKDDMGSDKDWNNIALGYSYAFSKRTNVYVQWGRTANDSGSAKRVDLAGETYSTYLFGMRHKF